MLVETLALSICLTADHTLDRGLIHAQPLLLDSLCMFGATSMLLEGGLRGKVVVAIVASVQPGHALEAACRPSFEHLGVSEDIVLSRLSLA